MPWPRRDWTGPGLIGTGQGGREKAPAPPWSRSPPTSLQCPLGDFAAVDTQTGAVVGGHLDLVVGPDDEVLQQQIVDVSVCDVLKLVPDGQPGQAVPKGREEGRGWRAGDSLMGTCPGNHV